MGHRMDELGDFRAETRAWLAAKLSTRCPRPGRGAVGQPQGSSERRLGALACPHGGAGLDRAHLAATLWRCRTRQGPVRRPDRRTEAHRCPVAAHGSRRELHRPDDPGTRRRRSEGSLAARNRPGRRRLGDGLLGARCRLGPRQPVAARRPRRRPLRPQRPQDLDFRRDGRGLHLRPGANLAGQAQSTSASA